MPVESHIKKFVFSLLLILSTSSEAKYFEGIKLQFSGEIGVYSMGVTKKPKEWYDLTIMYGVTPREVSHTKMIESFGLKQDFFFYNKNIDQLITRLYMSLNLYHTTGLKLKAEKFRDAPNGYYPINSIRGLLSLGVQLTQEKRKRNSYFFEMGMNDLWIINYWNNKTLKAEDYISMAFGINYNF